MNEHVDLTDAIEPGQDWDIYLFRPEDAEGVARIFRAVYGDGYPVRTYVEPRLLIEENAALRVISSVARTARGEVVGHNALYNSAADPGTYESGAGAVHAAYRGGKGIFTRMVDHGLEAATTMPQVNAVFCEPVSNHLFSQKLTDKAGFIIRALEVELMPAAAYEKEASASGRVSNFPTFRTFRARPHGVYIPKAYADVMNFLYEGLDDERDFRVSTAGLSSGKASDVRTRIFESAGVARIAVHEPGGDFAPRMKRLEEELQNRGVMVMQVWLRLACPDVGEAVDILRNQGFFLGGILPRWFDDDGMLMQKVNKTPEWDSILTYGDRAARILELVRSDWERQQ
jgi:hypothetical protein